jgi:hypothetical protein
MELLLAFKRELSNAGLLFSKLPRARHSVMLLPNPQLSNLAPVQFVISGSHNHGDHVYLALTILLNQSAFKLAWFNAGLLLVMSSMIHFAILLSNPRPNNNAIALKLEPFMIGRLAHGEIAS